MEGQVNCIRTARFVSMEQLPRSRRSTYFFHYFPRTNLTDWLAFLTYHVHA